MSVRVPPAHAKLEHVRHERVAYLKLIQGKITIEQYRDAIAPRHWRGGRLRRWWRGR
jgi:hypothetical protein